MKRIFDVALQVLGVCALGNVAYHLWLYSELTLALLGVVVALLGAPCAVIGAVYLLGSTGAARSAEGRYAARRVLGRSMVRRG